MSSLLIFMEERCHGGNLATDAWVMAWFKRKPGDDTSSTCVLSNSIVVIVVVVVMIVLY